MFEDLLEYLVHRKVYVEVSGLTPAGSEKILEKDSESDPTVYFLKSRKVIFVPDMVDKILFHDHGATIHLKH